MCYFYLRNFEIISVRVLVNRHQENILKQVMKNVILNKYLSNKLFKIV